MATTTPNFGWSVPTSTDLVKDGATAIETLGDAIDASLVDLKGGTSGQVLAKNSNTDMDFTWVAQDDSNAIQNAIVDAKGDLIGATAADTPARLAVGTNGQVLTADSAEATGLKWTTVGAGSLTKIKTVTFSGVTSTTTSFDSVFTSTYKNYMLVMSSLSGNAGQGLLFALRNGGSTIATQNFDGDRIDNVTIGSSFSGHSAAITVLQVAGTAGSSTMIVNRSQSPMQGSFHGVNRHSSTSTTGMWYTDSVNADGADGFILSAASGNIAGTVTVYGLEN
jgi:hypothetical protein